MRVERDKEIERANNAEQALALERSLKDQISTQSAATIKELQEKIEALELSKKSAEDLAQQAQVENFQMGYDDAVAQAKKFGLDYKKLLLDPAVDTTLVRDEAEAEGGDETPEP